ncbi:hypothetical protein D3C81_1830820 [compost metagenome]
MEHHTYLLAEAHHIGAGAVDVHTLYIHISGYPDIVDQVIHPVQGAEEGGFAAAGRADQGVDGVFLDIQVDIMKGVIITVKQIQVAYRYFRLHGRLLPSVEFFGQNPAGDGNQQVEEQNHQHQQGTAALGDLLGVGHKGRSLHIP